MPTRQTFHIYVDETSKQDTYFGVGAILCEDKAAAFLSDWIEQAIVRHREPPNRELHWKDFTAGRDRQALYTDIGTSLIGFTQSNRRMSYRGMLIESRHIVRDKSKHTIDDIITKFFFTLIFEVIQRPGGGVDYKVFIDSVDGSEDTNAQMLHSLNNKYKSTFNTVEGPFVSVEYVRLETQRMIQATDLLTAVIAYEMNGRHLVPNAAAHKKAVFEAMLEKSTLTTFTVPTKRFPPQFQIRHFDFSRSKAVPLKPVRAPQLRLLD
jgi:uncharacterized protein DUF3800